MKAPDAETRRDFLSSLAAALPLTTLVLPALFGAGCSRRIDPSNPAERAKIVALEKEIAPVVDLAKVLHDEFAAVSNAGDQAIATLRDRYTGSYNLSIAAQQAEFQKRMPTIVNALSNLSAVVSAIGDPLPAKERGTADGHVHPTDPSSPLYYLIRALESQSGVLAEHTRPLASDLSVMARLLSSIPELRATVYTDLKASVDAMKVTFERSRKALEREHVNLPRPEERGEF